jgi:hypothetical protein
VPVTSDIAVTATAETSMTLAMYSMAGTRSLARFENSQ